MTAQATQVTFASMQHLENMRCKMSALMPIVINPRSKVLGRIKHTGALQCVTGSEVQNQKRVMSKIIRHISSAGLSCSNAALVLYHTLVS